MPTYLNPAASGVTYKVQNTDGIWVAIPPGDSVQSWDDLTVYGFTQSSAAPVGMHSSWYMLQFSGERADTVSLGNSAKEVEVYNRSLSGELDVSGEVRLYLQDATAYAALLPAGRGVTLGEDLIRSKVSTIVVESLGTTTVDVWVRR